MKAIIRFQTHDFTTNTLNYLYNSIDSKSKDLPQCKKEFISHMSNTTGKGLVSHIAL